MADPLLSSEESTEGRIKGILESNSPLMEQARTQGMQAAQSRGLMNSSIATGAAQDAVTKAALPIASDDAGKAFQRGQGREVFGQQKEFATHQGDIQKGLLETEYTKRGELSQQEAGQTRELATHQAGLQKANMIAEYEQRGTLSAQEAQQQRDTIASEYGLRAGLSAQEFQQALQQAEAQFGFQKELTTLQGDIQRGMETTKLQYQTLFQTSQVAAAMYSDLQGQVSQILQNKDLKAEDKQRAISQLIAYTNKALAVQAALADAGGLDVNIGAVPNSASYGGGNTTTPPTGTTGSAPAAPIGGGSGGGGFGSIQIQQPQRPGLPITQQPF